MAIVDRWREFEAMLNARGLGWGLHYAPADLRWARSHEHAFGVRLDQLLPADYRAFVATVGYPVLGYQYYDREGFSFLPPQAMAALSPYVFDPEHEFLQAVDGAPTTCRHAFFTGYDLSEINGYALASDGVWVIEDSTAVESAGSFTEWLLSELDRQERRIEGLDVDQVAKLRAENNGEDDPHRLLNYSLGGTYDQAPYSPADLDLSWVEGQDGTPYSYGLVDASGRWRIPLGKRFLKVRPFRDGVAEVIGNVEGSNYSGPWRRIDADGRYLDDGGSR